jgi:phospholipase/carboxylesterase
MVYMHMQSTQRFLGISAILILVVASGFMFWQKTPKDETESLHYIVKQPTIASEKPPLMVMLHGAGSNEDDLFSLAQYLPGRFLIASVRAPIQVSPGNNYWYHFTKTNGKHVADTLEAEQSRVAILRFLEELKTNELFNPDSIYLMGFSQGAIMSFSVALTEPEKIRGIIALSGRILPDIEPKIVDQKRYASLRNLVIHGTQDNMLPIENARHSKQILTQHGIPFDYHELEMGHTVNEETINIINNWLK